LTAVSDFNFSLSLTGVRSVRFNLGQEFSTFNDSTEDGVLAIEPRAGDEGNEELRSVGVGTSIGHGQKTTDSVLNEEVFVSELSTIDGFTTSTVTDSEITTLSHESRDDSVENAVLEVEGLAALTGSLFTSAESSEVFSTLGGLVSEKFENKSAQGWAMLSQRHL
jgi:hypothetical protein